MEIKEGRRLGLTDERRELARELHDKFGENERERY